MAFSDMVRAELETLRKTWESWGIHDFEPWEFICKSGCGWANADHALLIALQELRDDVGEPIKVTKNGGCRCVRQSRKIGGALLGQHPLGRAADIYVRGMKQRDLKAAAETIEAFNISGIGLGRTRIHVDVRGVYGGDPARWSY